MHVFFKLFIIIVFIVIQALCYSIYPISLAQKRNILQISSADKNLDRELDLFFEKAAESGFDNIRSLTLEERVERVSRGEELENKIFELRDRIVDLGSLIFRFSINYLFKFTFKLENSALNQDSKTSLKDIAELRESLMKMKVEYIKVVGGNDLPIYFGKVSESLQ